MIKIVDNFLPDFQFEKLKHDILEPNFSWKRTDGVSGEDSRQDNVFYLVHQFFTSDGFEKSKNAQIIDPLLARLNMASLIRAKVNLYPKQEALFEHGYHTDFDFFHKGFLFYLNTCNGYTKIQGEEPIETIANRALFFDSYIPHTSTGCTDKPYRMTLNINYFERVFP